MREFFHRMPVGFTPVPSPGYVPHGRWLKCPACEQLLYRQQFENEHKVCPTCGHHFRISAREWIDLLLDPDSFVEHDGDLTSGDPLEFCDAHGSYTEQLAAAQRRAHARESMMCGSGTVDTFPVELAVTDFQFMGGSMGSVYGEKVTRTVERAAVRGATLVTVNASSGARMHEGIFSLMQMAKVSVALTQLAAARQLHIALLVDPCYGGVSASYASAADITVAEAGAHIGFTGPRVIEQALREALPPRFQTAEYLLEHGLVDHVAERGQMRQVLANLLHIHQHAALETLPSRSYAHAALVE